MPLQRHEIRTLVIIGLLLLSLLLYLLLSQKTLEEVIFSHETVERAQALEIRVWNSNHPFVGSFISISKKIPVDSPAYAELRQLLGEIRLRPYIIQPNGHILRDGESCEFYFYGKNDVLLSFFTIYEPKELEFPDPTPKAYRITSKFKLEEIKDLLERHGYDIATPEEN